MSIRVPTTAPAPNKKSSFFVFKDDNQMLKRQSSSNQAAIKPVDHYIKSC